MHAERRHCLRSSPESGFVVTCYVGEEAGGPPYNVARDLVDLSSRGACIVTVGRLREKMPVIVQITAPRDFSRFRVRGRVRWSRSLEPQGINLAGVRFEEVLEAFGEKLRFLGGQQEDASPARTAEPRRRFKRFTPSHAEVTCIPEGLWRKLGLASNAARQLRDLSLGGAQIMCSRQIKPGRQVELLLQFQKPPASLTARGEVRWCRRDTLSLEPRWQIGLTFKYLTPDQEANLRALDKFYLG